MKMVCGKMGFNFSSRIVVPCNIRVQSERASTTRNIGMSPAQQHARVAQAPQGSFVQQRA